MGFYTETVGGAYKILQREIWERVSGWIDRNRTNRINVQIVKWLNGMIEWFDNAIDEFGVAFLIERA